MPVGVKLEYLVVLPNHSLFIFSLIDEAATRRLNQSFGKIRLCFREFNLLVMNQRFRGGRIFRGVERSRYELI